jgi:hypothetical protein
VGERSRRHSDGRGCPDEPLVLEVGLVECVVDGLVPGVRLGLSVLIEPEEVDVFLAGVLSDREGPPLRDNAFVEVVVGVGFVVAGAAFARFGVRRLRSPRRRSDLDWDRNHPIRAFLMSPGASSVGLSSDRYGALTWLVGGVILVLLGAAVLVSAL